MKAQLHLVSNGMTSLFQRHGSADIISLQFWVQTGSIHEAPHLGSGLSHLLEHMVFKGTRHYDAQELAQRVSAHGGVWNAYTSNDRTVYHIEGPTELWRVYLEILHELVFFPSFPRDEWEKERDVIRREMAMYDDDPQDVAYRLLMDTIYLANPRRYPVIGHRARFDALSYEDMCQYHRDRYVPSRVTVVCSFGGGAPLSYEDFITELEQRAAEVPARASYDMPQLVEQMQWGARQRRSEFAQPTSNLMLGWRIPAANHPDMPALSLLSHILGTGRAACLHGHFHDELGLAHDVSSSMIPAREGEGFFLIDADCEREKRDELRDAILLYIAELVQQRELLDMGLTRALNQMRAQRLRGLASVQGRANALAMSWHLTRNIQSMEEWEQALRLVRTDDLLRVMDSYFLPHKFCEVSIDPLGSNEEQDDQSNTQLDQPLVEGQLPNGLRLVMRQDSSIPLIHLSLALAAGCPSESQQLAGINSLLSECLLKGTHTRSARDIAESLENRGASISSEAGNNTLLIHANCLKEDLALLLSVLADILLHPLLDDNAIETEKQAMIATILDAEQDPLSLALRRMRPLFFGESGYGVNPDGTVESISALNKQQLQQQHARICCASNAVLSLVGDFDTEEISSLINKELGTLPTGQPLSIVPSAPLQSGEERLQLDKQQCVIALALPGVAVNSENILAHSIILEWCRDMAGPLFTEIREERGLAYYVAAAAMSGLDTGCFYIYMGTSPEQEKEAREALEQILADMAEQGMDEEDYTDTLSTIMLGHRSSMQSMSRVCKNIAIDSLLGLPSDSCITLAQRIRQVSLEQVNQCLRELMQPQQVRAWVTVGTEA